GIVERLGTRRLRGSDRRRSDRRGSDGLLDERLGVRRLVLRRGPSVLLERELVVDGDRRLERDRGLALDGLGHGRLRFGGARILRKRWTVLGRRKVERRRRELARGHDERRKGLRAHRTRRWSRVRFAYRRRLRRLARPSGRGALDRSDDARHRRLSRLARALHLESERLV